MDGMITEVAARGQADMSLVSVDSWLGRAKTRLGWWWIRQCCRCWSRPWLRKRGGRYRANAPLTEQEQTREQERVEHRRIRRRRRARLTAAALGRSRGGLTCKVHLAADRRCRPLAFVLAPGPPMAPGSGRCWRRSRCTSRSGIRAPALMRWPPIRRTRPGPIGPACASEGSRRSSRRRLTRPPTASSAEAPAGGRSASTPRNTGTATPWSAASTRSRPGLAWPPDTTDTR